MAAGVCTACQRHGELEEHHLAGKVNNPDVTVDVCHGCHDVLSSWQKTSGLPLRRDKEHPERVKQVALHIGALHFFALVACREGYPERGNLLLLIARDLQNVFTHGEGREAADLFQPKPSAVGRTGNEVAYSPDSEPEQFAQGWVFITYYLTTFGMLEHVRAVLGITLEDTQALMSTDPGTLNRAWMWYRNQAGAQEAIRQAVARVHDQMGGFSGSLWDYAYSFTDPTADGTADAVGAAQEGLVDLMTAIRPILPLMADAVREYQRWIAPNL